MVTLSERDVTLQYESDKEITYGNQDFLLESEKRQLLDNVKIIKQNFRDELLEGNSILLEWSFAQNCDLNEKPIEKNGLYLKREF